MNDFVERSLELCHYQILRGGVALQKQLTPAVPPISGVSNQLEIALISIRKTLWRERQGVTAAGTVEVYPSAAEVALPVA